MLFFISCQELVEIVMPGIQPDGLIDQYRILPKISLQFVQGVHACLIVVQKGMYQPVPERNSPDLPAMAVEFRMQKFIGGSPGCSLAYWR